MVPSIDDLAHIVQKGRRQKFLVIGTVCQRQIESLQRVKQGVSLGMNRGILFDIFKLGQKKTIDREAVGPLIDAVKFAFEIRRRHVLENEFHDLALIEKVIRRGRVILRNLESNAVAQMDRLDLVVDAKFMRVSFGNERGDGPPDRQAIHVPPYGEAETGNRADRDQVFAPDSRFEVAQRANGTQRLNAKLSNGWRAAGGIGDLFQSTHLIANFSIRR